MRIGIALCALTIVCVYESAAVDISGAYPCINECVDGGGNTEECAQGCVSQIISAFDSDGDGIPNVFEFFYGTNPNTFDSLQDPDGDGLLNLQEFFQRSDPFDAYDPLPTFFVSPDGFNLPERGTREAPWRDIAYALSLLEPNAELPVNIVLKSGAYQEDLLLKPGVRLRSALFNRAVISGTVVGADNCALQNITLVARRSGDVLLTLDNVRMAVLNVDFRGGFFRTGTGVWLDGAAGLSTLLEDCTFENLQIGADVNGAIPLIRRCRFDNLNQAAVYLRASSENFAGRNLGNSANAGSGWNFFGVAVDGAAVVSERSDVVPMENNDWATDDPFSSTNRVDGPGDIEPFLASGSAVLAGAVYCSVWDTATQNPVTDAVVSLTPSGYAPVGENDSGVYVFSAVPDGNYSVTAVSPSLGSASFGVRVESGGIVTVNLPLGEAAPTGPGCECNDSKGAAPLVAGDVFVSSLALAILLGLGKRKERKGNV